MAGSGVTGESVTRFSVPPLWTLPAPLAVTHSAPPTTATPLGALPTLIVFTTVFVAGSIRDPVPLVLLVSQTDSSTAMVVGLAPASMLALMVPELGSIWDTIPSKVLATQRNPLATATPAGPFPTAMVLTTLFASGLIL